MVKEGGLSKTQELLGAVCGCVAGVNRGMAVGVEEGVMSQKTVMSLFRQWEVQEGLAVPPQPIPLTWVDGDQHIEGSCSIFEGTGGH